jgi:hypothetical protein
MMVRLELVEKTKKEEEAMGRKDKKQDTAKTKKEPKRKK